MNNSYGRLALAALCAAAALTKAQGALAQQGAPPPPQFPGFQATPARVDPAKDPKRWVLTFSDEFSGSKLDKDKWIDSYPGNERTHSNNEQQWYATDGYTLSQGALHLRAERRKMGGMPYTSGMVASYGKFFQQFGWFEIRARLPKGKGMWPAFWLLPENRSWPPEIDVLEVLGHEPAKVYLTNHWTDGAGKHQSNGGSWTGPDLSAAYHTYAVDWSPASIIWYVDGIERFRSTKGVPAEPMYVLANLAVGGDWPGNPDAATRFPSAMDIDYIRVYQSLADEGSGAPPPPPPFGDK